MPLDCSMFLDIMAKHVRAKTIVSFQLPLEFPYNDTELINLLARMWKENVKHGVGHQLENIFFAYSSYCGTSDKWESLVLRELLQPYLYETPDGTYACDYNPAADDFNKVPGWSTVDIKTPKESRIKPWYVYAPDIPDFEFDEGIIGFYLCQNCNEGEKFHTCPYSAPKRLGLILALIPTMNSSFFTQCFSLMS